MASPAPRNSAFDFQPNYFPDFDRYSKRYRSLPKFSKPALPPHCPNLVQNAMSWTGLELPESEYTIQLSLENIQEISEACHKLAGISIGDITRENFTLPTLGNVLASKRLQLHNGNGMVRLQGLDPTKFSRRENIIIFAGLSTHFSERWGLQSGGKLVIHIKDLAATEGPARNSIGYAAPYCNVEIPLHTDAGDVVAMYTLSPTSKGGHGTFASTTTVYNELATSDPESLLSLLRDDWPLDRPPDRKGVDGKGLYYHRPIMFMNNGFPEMIFSRGALIRSPRGLRTAAIPNITQTQNAALDALHYAAVKHMIRIEYQQGDMLFFNNRRLLHGREAFEDEPGKIRHFLRLWLQDEELAGEAPHPTLIRQWRNIFPHDLPQDDAKQWPLEPDKS